MKYIKKTRAGLAAGVAVLALSAGACEFIDPTTTNPNVVPEATIDQLFTGIQVNTFYFAESQLSRIASIWTQQMAGTDRQFASLDNYIITETSADDPFNSMYTGGGLIDLKQATARAEDQGRRVYAGILKIHEAYMVGMAASIYGDIPYSEAGNDEIDEPALDEQAAVYAAVQSLLDEAIADLNSGAGAGPGGTDLNFGGSAGPWIDIANTLKARFHMHMAEVNGQSAYQAALNAAQNGIMDPSNNWLALHTTTATEQNLWSQFMRDRSGYISAGDHLVPLMVEEDDPRLPIYFSEASGGGFAARDSELSPTGFGAAGFDFPILTCAENAYIMAEANYELGNEGAARDAAKAGVACQEAFFGVDLGDELDELDGASGFALFEEIMEQKYTALFLNMEVYNDYKRTCLPAIDVRPGGVPGRPLYSGAERQSNPNIPEVGQQPARNDNDPNPCT